VQWHIREQTVFMRFSCAQIILAPPLWVLGPSGMARQRQRRMPVGVNAPYKQTAARRSSAGNGGAAHTQAALKKTLTSCWVDSPRMACGHRR
jgi:hypothetical protein